MKGIVTRANLDGTFDQVGTNNRTIVEASRLVNLLRHARAYAGDRAVHVEVFYSDRIYDEADEVVSLPALTSTPRVYVVQGEHYSMSGRAVTAHATRGGAEAKALELVNLLLAYLHLTPAIHYVEGLRRVQKKVGRDEADVWIDEYEVQT